MSTGDYAMFNRIRRAARVSAACFILLMGVVQEVAAATYGYGPGGLPDLSAYLVGTARFETMANDLGSPVSLSTGGSNQVADAIWWIPAQGYSVFVRQHRQQRRRGLRLQRHERADGALQPSSVPGLFLPHLALLTSERGELFGGYFPRPFQVIDLTLLTLSIVLQIPQTTGHALVTLAKGSLGHRSQTAPRSRPPGHRPSHIGIRNEQPHPSFETAPTG